MDLIHYDLDQFLEIQDYFEILKLRCIWSYKWFDQLASQPIDQPTNQPWSDLSKSNQPTN